MNPISVLINDILLLEIEIEKIKALNGNLIDGKVRHLQYQIKRKKTQLCQFERADITFK